MWKKKLVLGVGAVVLVAFLFLSNASAQPQANTESESSRIIGQYKINELVKEIETVHCKMTDKRLSDNGLSPEKILKVREFCSKPAKDKLDDLVGAYRNAGIRLSPFGKITGFSNSYSCIWDGLNTGIPTYADMYVTSSSCTWNESPSKSSCKVQGAIGCLWGCTNVDPVLTWGSNSKYYPSTTSLEGDIFKKGYQKVTLPVYGAQYRRTLAYGYSYEVGAQSVDGTGKGTWHTEGPEPDPRFNWSGYLGGWWPVEVFYWHQGYNC